ncbi:hypothetical protein PVAP13_8KG080100 [Panicum virgatum]|uniref:Pentatricopeptide repeat-containing protein n=1 Tax=Panicum virgatum TaxID=38727 RepID=A0A8T0PNF7_PANVG|nr:hypothetical protein PVAP13_8KG080100 [Panicum virgatum]
MSRRASAAIAGRIRSGNLGLDDAVKLFDELIHHARPASVIALSKLLTFISRAQGRGSSSSELVPSLFNRMVRACSSKVAPNLHTYSILINCFRRMGRLELGFTAFGLILKTGWRVDGIVINQLLKGLCDSKCASEAMDIMLRRMPECTPNVVSYNIILKGLCEEKRAEEALQLLHMMVDDECGSCPPDVVSYNTVINGFFRDGQVDRAYNRLL